MPAAPPRTLPEVLDRRALRRLAGGRSFERGEDYFASGEVRALAEDAGTITAKVRGTRQYRVELWVEGDGIGYSCTCPIGADGDFCKHDVAVGLAWLAKEGHGQEAPRGAPKPRLTLDDVRAYLTGLDRSALVDLLVQQTMDDDRLLERLLMKTATKGGKGLDLATFRAAIDNAVDAGDFVDYASAHDYASGIEEVVESIADLLKEGHASDVIALTEHALARIEGAMGSVDDSDGYMGGLLVRLQEVHHAACRKARPDPEALAKRLFAWELRTDYDTFYGAAATYADLLGPKGLAVYRRLAEAEWARVPSLGPGRDDPEKYSKRFRITHIMETLARESGDIEALVAVKSRDLSHAYAYLEIAEIYRQARKHDLALEWAARGVEAFPERTDGRLREFLAGEYHRRKRHDEAMALIWAEFTDSPDLERYQKLRTHADRIDRWPEWREKALAFTREGIAKAARAGGKNRFAWRARMDHSELVRIFLGEKDVEAAWREAKEGGCSTALWLELAAKRESDHPQDALPIYQSRVEPTLAQKNDHAYREVVALLRKIGTLMVRLGRGQEFAAYLASIRVAHKPKRNFMKRLDGTKWS